MPITIRTRQTEANKAAEAWDKQYPPKTCDSDKRAIGPALRRLGANPDPDRVDAVIGNTSWTNPGACSNCDDSPSEIAEVGEPPDYESRTARMCLPCLKSAVEQLEGMKL